MPKSNVQDSPSSGLSVEIVGEQPAEEEIWEVEAILDKGIRDNGSVEYLVKWKNWAGEPTWEPEENCSDCKAMVKRFENKLKKLKSTQIGSSSAKKNPQTRANNSKQRINNPTEVQIMDNGQDEDEEEDDNHSTPDQQLIENDTLEVKVIERRLRLKEIVGAINSSDIFLVVKWHGIDKLEKVRLKDLRRIYCQEVLDFFINKIAWAT